MNNNCPSFPKVRQPDSRWFYSPTYAFPKVVCITNVFGKSHFCHIFPNEHLVYLWVHS